MEEGFRAFEDAGMPPGKFHVEDVIEPEVRLVNPMQSPRHNTVSFADNAGCGEGSTDTVRVCVVESAPFEFCTFNLNVYVPEAVKQKGCGLEEDWMGLVAPGHVHVHCVGFPVDVLVIAMQTESQPEAGPEVVNAACGSVAEGTESSISSTAKEGSFPIPSSLLTQRIASLKFGMFSQMEGRIEENEVQKPCPGQVVGVLGVFVKPSQLAPPSILNSTIASSSALFPSSMYLK